MPVKDQPSCQSMSRRFTEQATTLTMEYMRIPSEHSIARITNPNQRSDKAGTAAALGALAR